MGALPFRTRTVGATEDRRTQSARMWASLPRMLSKVRQWKSSPKKSWRTLLLITAGITIGLGIFLLLLLWLTLPNISDPETMFASESTVIVDRNGIELYRLFSEQDRTYVRGTDISDRVKNATIAIEDERFFTRSGCVDVIGFTRAALSQILPGIFVRSGGSTLTQQFAKNALVGRQRSLLRKVRELMLACQLERTYDKHALLELYLNWIPYGHNAYGIEQAAKNYFSSSAKDLTLAQAAVLAALPQRPSYFSPYGQNLHTSVTADALARILRGEITSAEDIPSSAIRIGLIGTRIGSGALSVYVGGRTDQVLQNMESQHMITAAERIDALAALQTLTFAPERQSIRAPHFVLDIEKQATEILGIDNNDDQDGGILEKGGFRITTTLDWELQQAAEKAVAAHAEDILKRFGAHNIALVAMDPLSGDLLAYVGNTDFRDDEHEGKIDMALRPRQPGSSFKAFTYLAAFEKGYNPGSVVYDVPTRFGDDVPQNYDGTFWGPITMRRALAGSRNIPAVKAFFLAGGEEELLSLSERVGVTTPSRSKEKARGKDPEFAFGWPLSIGAAETPLLEMVQGYATIAAEGIRHAPRSILRIADREGNLRYLPPETHAEQVVDARFTAMITSVLSDTAARPNDYWQSILSVPGVDAAAKTGTSNKCLERDTKGVCTLRRPESTWTLGFTPSLVAGVWVGNATSESLAEKADGLTIAAPIWHDFMVAAERMRPSTTKTFSLPDGIARPMLSELSGMLASSCTPLEKRHADLVTIERVPAEDDPACTLLRVDKVTGLLASDACPADAVEEQAFFRPASELPSRWPLWEQDVQDWATKQRELWLATPDHSGSLLPLPLAPTASCDPSLTPGRFDPIEVDIAFPRPGDVVHYPSFEPDIIVRTQAPIREVKIFVDGKPLRTFTEAPYRGSLRVPRTIDKSGRHTLRAEVTDAYYKTAVKEVEFVFE